MFADVQLIVFTSKIQSTPSHGFRAPLVFVLGSVGQTERQKKTTKTLLRCVKIKIKMYLMTK